MDPVCSDASTILFWETVPFVCKAPDKGEVTKQLTVRILFDQIHKTKVLKVCLSSEEDLFFLHTFEITVEDYSRLKHEQGILVDFDNFPHKLISLFQRFLVELWTTVLKDGIGAQSSEVQFNEINDFNKLCHLKLAFRPSNDQTVKSHLATRLMEVTDQCRSLQFQLDSSRKDLSEITKEFTKKKELITELKEQYETVVLQRKMEEKRIHVEFTEKLALEKGALKLQYDNERHEMEIKLREQVDMLLKRNQDMEVANKELLDGKYYMDTRCAELAHKLAIAEGLNSALKEDTQQLRSMNKTLVTDKQELERKLSEITVESKALTQKVHDKEQMIELQKRHIGDNDAACNNLKFRLEELLNQIRVGKEAEDKLESNLHEQKCIVDKLAGELRIRKGKCSKQTAILKKLEEIVDRKEQELKKNSINKNNLEDKFKVLKAESKCKEIEVQDLKMKLATSSKQLADNDRMIHWLNEQMNGYKSKKWPSVLPRPTNMSNAYRCSSGISVFEGDQSPVRRLSPKGSRDCPSPSSIKVPTR